MGFSEKLKGSLFRTDERDSVETVSDGNEAVETETSDEDAWTELFWNDITVIKEMIIDGCIYIF